MKEKKNSNWKHWWTDFLISVLGTAIGVGLTFAVSKIVEDHKKDQAQRLTAMMIIDDMEKSLEIVKHINKDEEQRYLATQYVMGHLAVIDSVPYDTLTLVSNYIMDGSYISSDLEFSESGEKVFQSAQDAWMNLNDLSFIRNVDEFYKSRAMLKDAIQTHYIWQRPVSKTENDEMLTNSDILESWEKFNIYLKGKLEEPKTQKYLKQYPQRKQFYNDIIEQWNDWIEESKALMNITEEDMEEFRE